MSTEKIVAAFQTWQNGGLQVSGLYLSSIWGQSAVDDFIETHYSSGTYARLETFVNEEDAKKAYNECIDILETA